MISQKTKYYYACGDNVISVAFTNCYKAWEYVYAHSNEGYDCVVESCYKLD